MTKTLYFGNRALAAVAVAVVFVAFVLVFWSGGGPQSEIEEKLELLALAGDIAPSDAPRARIAEMTAAVDAALAKDAVVRIGDGDGDLNGRAAILSRLQEAIVSVREMRVTLRGLSISQEGSDEEDTESWEARFFLDAEGTGPYGSLRDSRRVTARFEEMNGDWMLTFAAVSARDDAEPEERP